MAHEGKGGDPQDAGTGAEMGTGSMYHCCSCRGSEHHWGHREYGGKGGSGDVRTGGQMGTGSRYRCCGWKGAVHHWGTGSMVIKEGEDQTSSEDVGKGGCRGWAV